MMGNQQDSSTTVMRSRDSKPRFPAFEVPLSAAMSERYADKVGRRWTGKEEWPREMGRVAKGEGISPVPLSFRVSFFVFGAVKL